MHILITGGTGFIGRALIDTLLLDGHQISVLTRNPGRAEDELPSGVLAVKWDGFSSKGWLYHLEENDAIINLAGESIAGESLTAVLTRRWTEDQKNRIKQSRLDVGIALVEAIQAASQKPQILIQASAVGYYGPSGEESLTESAPAGDDFLATVCKSWEDSTAEIEKMGIRRVIIRTGLVFAPKGGILPIMLLPFHFFVGGPIGNGKQYIPWIHIRDQVDAIRFLLTNEKAQGAYNLSAPNPVSNNEFGRIVGQVLQRPNRIPTPGFALKLVLGDKSSLVLSGQNAVPQRLLDSGFQFKFETLEAALKDLCQESGEN